MNFKEFHKYKVYENGQIAKKNGNGYLRQHTNPNGYKIVNLTDNGSRYTLYTHRLVAELFIDNPYNLREVDHIDGDINNNCVDNLRWISRQEHARVTYANSRKDRKTS